jgi:hypothetical protein
VLQIVADATKTSKSPLYDDPNEFQYSAQLEDGQIRLLHFEKGQASDNRQRLRLFTSTLLGGNDTAEAETVPYLTLSYVWGPQEPGTMKEVVINGQVFLVDPNLASALQYLEKRIEIPIWIDAICINQKNSGERNSQVKQMRDIYGLAQRTIIYLGEGDDDMRSMMKHIATVGKKAKSAGLLNVSYEDLMSPDMSVISPDNRKLEIKKGVESLVRDLQRGQLALSRSHLDTFAELGCGPWFSRVC